MPGACAGARPPPTRALSRAVVAARRQPADDLRRRCSRAAGDLRYRRERWDHARRRFRRRRLRRRPKRARRSWCCSTGSKAARAATMRCALMRALRAPRLARRGGAFPRLLAASRTACRAPITPATRPRSTGCCAGSQAEAGERAAATPRASRSAATRCSSGWASAAADAARGRGRGRGLGAARPHGRGRCARPRLQPACTRAHFLATLQAQERGQARAAFPVSSTRDAVLRARTLREFDNVVTAPLHGFRDTDDYWTRASSKPWLRASACRRCCSTRATTRSCPRTRCRARRGVRRGQLRISRDEGGHVGLRQRRVSRHIDWLPPNAVLRASCLRASDALT